MFLWPFMSLHSFKLRGRLPENVLHHRTDSALSGAVFDLGLFSVVLFYLALPGGEMDRTQVSCIQGMCFATKLQYILCPRARFMLALFACLILIWRGHYLAVLSLFLVRYRSPMGCPPGTVQGLFLLRCSVSLGSAGEQAGASCRPAATLSLHLATKRPCLEKSFPHFLHSLASPGPPWRLSLRAGGWNGSPSHHLP